MLCSRCLWLVSLVFTVATGSVRAQQPGSAPSQRIVTFRFDRKLETEVAEIFLAPGSSTTVHMPGPIRKGGFTLKGGQGRITAMQPPSNPNVLVLLASGLPDPERIPLFVATIDGQHFPFMLATVPGVMDSEVRVLSWKEKARDRPPWDPMMEVLIQSREIAVKSFESSGADGLVSPWVEKAVRQDDRVYLRVHRRRSRKAPDRPWRVRAAALVGPQGELLKVVDVQWSRNGGLDINVILAELPEGASDEYGLTSLQLRGEDGMDIQLDGKGVLP